MVSVKEGGNPQKALNIGEFGSAGIMVVVMYFLIKCFTKWCYLVVQIFLQWEFFMQL